jgi:copper oxidase (laccase) domain-containing protein
MDLSFEQFPALSAIGICRHVFIQRIPGIDVSHDKAEVLERLDAAHREIRNATGFGNWPLFTAEQIHGNKIAIVDRAVASAVLSGVDGREFPACDGIITNQRSVALGIYVADCCAVYIVDPKTPAIGLVHSGRKGTEFGVVTNAIRQMIERFGSDPSNMIVQLSPCIRPPEYEVDFAAEISRQCRALGVQHIHDSGICTACDLARYYSYRAEKGKTGRMLALLGLNPPIAN